MTWSTRELAELADTTVNAVRHYHSLGVLDAPQRHVNGYKQYGVPHLVRLIQVRRLVELGVPLGEIGAPGDALVEPDGLRLLDAQAEKEIERLCQARSDIAAIIGASAPVDTPRGFEGVAPRLSIADRSLINVHSRLHDEESVADLMEMVSREPESIRQRFYELRPDTNEPTRQRLAHQIARHGVNWRSADRPWRGARSVPRRRPRDHTQTIAEILAELYGSAQRDVIDRATLLGPCALHDRDLELSA